MDTIRVAKFAQHRVNWITVCQCYLGHTLASVCMSCEWPISVPINRTSWYISAKPNTPIRAHTQTVLGLKRTQLISVSCVHNRRVYV